jgi:hypothetical protein
MENQNRVLVDIWDQNRFHVGVIALNFDADNNVLSIEFFMRGYKVTSYINLVQIGSVHPRISDSAPQSAIIRNLLAGKVIYHFTDTGEKAVADPMAMFGARKWRNQQEKNFIYAWLKQRGLWQQPA